MKHYKAVLFDMDGVLIDSEQLMTKAGMLALRDYGIDAKPEDFVPFVGRGEDLYIGGVAEKYGHRYDPEMKQRCYDYFGQYVETDAQVPKEIPDILFRLKEHGIKICVCTSADWNKVIHNLRAMGVGKEVFDAFITGDDVKRKKPDPEIYLKGAEQLDIEPENCVVVEDAPNGILAAKAAGMLAVGIDTSFSEEVLKKQAGPDWMVHSLSELMDIVVSR
jgi:cytidine deaminase